jgi:hydrogenase nickel incorporation protein HypA/HybF
VGDEKRSAGAALSRRLDLQAFFITLLGGVMHEVSLVSGLIAQLERIAREQGCITGVKVRLGALAHVSPEHFRWHFSQAARGTALERVRVDLEALTDVHDPQAQDIVVESVEIER